MKKAKQIIVICLFLLAVSPARAGKIRTTLTVLTSLDTHQTYTWFAPGYASTHCQAQAAGSASGTYDSINASASGTSDCRSYMRPAATGTKTFTGHVLYLQMPDSRVIVASCDKRWSGWTPGGFRECREPQCSRCNAEIGGDKVKIEWSVSIDNSKSQTETYKIQAVLQPKATN